MQQLAERYDLHPKTGAQWQKRPDVHDAPMGPKPPCSTGLPPEQEALGVAFRRHTLRSLDDCLSALQTTIPRLTRSSWHRCFQRHGLSRLPEVDGDMPAQPKFKTYPLGYCHIDMAEVHTAEGRLDRCVAIDRASKFAVAERPEQATRRVAAHVLRALMAAVPYTRKTVLTANGTQFTALAHVR
jgi:hypothetical protein